MVLNGSEPMVFNGFLYISLLFPHVELVFELFVFLDCAFGILYFGLWAFGREFWILGFGLCTLNFGPWTWGFGFRILNFKLGTLDIGRWPLGFGL